MWTILKTLIGDLTPGLIKTDFETASINAMAISFPGIRISSCIFHLGQAIDRKIKDLMLANTYATSFQVKKYKKAPTALSYVKYSEIENQFYLLRQSPTFPNSLIPLYNYFSSNYLLATSLFPPNLWHSRNINDPLIRRTNNTIEGWHNTFANTFGLCKHSFIYLFLN